VTTERYEEAKAELKKTMTVKMQKKKEAATLRLQHKAQQETSSLVKKHSEEMLRLLQSKQEELAKELEEEIVSVRSENSVVHWRFLRKLLYCVTGSHPYNVPKCVKV